MVFSRELLRSGLLMSTMGSDPHEVRGKSSESDVAERHRRKTEERPSRRRRMEKGRGRCRESPSGGESKGREGRTRSEHVERERLANEDKILEGRDEEGGVIGGEGGAGTPGLDGSEKEVAQVSLEEGKGSGPVMLWSERVVFTLAVDQPLPCQDSTSVLNCVMSG